MLNVKCLITSYNVYMLTGEKNCNDSSILHPKLKVLVGCVCFSFKWFALFFKNSKKKN